jgi:hypothetical protein
MAAVPLTARTTTSPNFAVSEKLATPPLGFFFAQSASLSGARVPSLTSWPYLRKPAARALATSPEPRIPIFIIAPLSSNLYDKDEAMSTIRKTV